MSQEVLPLELAARVCNHSLHILTCLGSSQEAFRVNEHSFDVHQLVVGDSDHIQPLGDVPCRPQPLNVQLEALHRLVEFLCTAH